MKKFTLLTILFTVFLFFGNQNISFGQLLMDENFSYTAGDLITNNGWVAHSGGGTQPITVNNGGLTYAGYIDSGIGNAALADNTGEDDNKSFTVQSSGIVYTAFMIKVTGVSAGYFFHYGGQPIGNAFRGKVFMDATNHFGLSFSSNTATPAASTFSTGTTYLMVLKYEIVAGNLNDKVSLFIFSGGVPATEPATPTIGPLADASQPDINPGCVAIRQFSSSQNLIIDGIRVATSWNDVLNATIPAPTNYPTSFTASTAPVTINLNWVDAVGGQLPSAYLILGSNANNIISPVDGVPVPDDPNLAAGTGALNILQGVQTASFTNLPPSTPYYFKIFPYTNSGSSIKYKTDGTPPSANITTSDYLIIITKDFNDQTFDPWDTISLSSNKGWTIQSSGGNYYAYINGYGGSASSDDWLISPSMNFDAYQEETLTFLTASNYTGPDIEVKISTDYVTGANPNTGTWAPLTATLSPGGWVWTPSGNVDVSGFNGGNVHVAFRYISGITSSTAKAWEIDNIIITGRPSNVPTVTTDPNVTTITHNSATTGGTIITDGGATIIARGICYSTSSNPTVSDPHTTEPGTLGNFTSLLTGLNPQTTYYLRAYATTINGNGYGDIVSFTTLCEPYAPEIDFFADALVIRVGDTVNFFDASLYCPTYWKWSFVGGEPYVSYDQNPVSIVYNYPGVFNVCLDASNNNGYSSDCKNGYITVLGATNAKIVMTEIMYNPPEHGTDTLEFIELLNNDTVSWNLKDFYFDQGITFVFPDISFAPGEYLLVAKSASAMQNAFGKAAQEWTEGSLNNNGEPIVIKDYLGYLVDSVFFGSAPPWDTLANGYGTSLELCDPNSDNTDPANWRHAVEFQLVNASGDSIWASPLAGCTLLPVAGFSANGTTIIEEEYVTFTDESYLDPISWEWTFEGGTPENFSGQIPPPVQYNIWGIYDVTLKVSNLAGSNTLIKPDYILVGVDGISTKDAGGFTIYPNPSDGTFKVILNTSNPVLFRIFNQLSTLVYEKKSDNQINLFDQSNLTPGVYIIQMTDLITKQTYTQKLIIQ